MDLYNFNHGLGAPKTLSFGWFDVDVTQAHCDNVKLLPKNSSHSFTYDANVGRIVESIPGRRGQLVPTGTLRPTARVFGQSKLVPGSDQVSERYDAVLLLSFLTGRRVYLETELEGDVVHRYISGAVDVHFFQFWHGGSLDIQKLKSSGLRNALYNVVNAYVAPELIGMAAYANIALESVFSQWIKDQNATKYPQANIISKCLSEFSDWLKMSLSRSVRMKLISLLEGERVSARIIEDIEKRIGNIANQRSAVNKMELFLSGIGVIGDPPSKDQAKRVSKLNKLRNAVAHRGDIDRRMGATEDHAMEIALGVTLLEIEIVQYYLAAHVLGIHYTGLEQSRRDLATFFETGVYNGQDMFGELYSDFIARAEAEWIDEGIMR